MEEALLKLKLLYPFMNPDEILKMVFSEFFTSKIKQIEIDKINNEEFSEENIKKWKQINTQKGKKFSNLDEAKIWLES